MEKPLSLVWNRRRFTSDITTRSGGVPEHDSRALWEKLILDGFQAGLSWITILKKRDNFRAAFDGFDPVKVAAYGPAEEERLLADAGIIRHGGKIRSTIRSAQLYLEIEAREGFADWMWRYVDGAPVVNSYRTMAEVPAATGPVDADLEGPSKRPGSTSADRPSSTPSCRPPAWSMDHLTGCPPARRGAGTGAMSTVETYLRFAREFARGVCDPYADLCEEITRTPAILAYLDTLPPPKRQPNLLLATFKYLYGVPETVRPRWSGGSRSDEALVRHTMLARSTQTNEPARCATLLPVFGLIPGPLALIEVGASAGLCLLPERLRLCLWRPQDRRGRSDLSLQCLAQHPPARPPAGGRLAPRPRPSTRWM